MENFFVYEENKNYRIGYSWVKSHTDASGKRFVAWPLLLDTIVQSAFIYIFEGEKFRLKI